MDSTVSGGMNYSYRVKAYNVVQTATSYGIEKSLKRLTPGSVSAATVAAKGVLLKWTEVNGADGYYVYRKKAKGTYSKIATVLNGNTVSYTDTKTVEGTTYTYYVVPYESTNIGSYANTKTGAFVKGVTITSIRNTSKKSMTVSYGKNLKGEGYQIQYGTSKNFAKGIKTEKVSKASTARRVIRNLKKGSTYYVRVRVFRKVGSATYYSVWSAAKKVKINQ